MTETTKLRLYSYCRVSTKQQEIENQRRSIKKFIKNNKDKYEIIKGFEEKKSAFKDRPEYNKMLNMLYTKENNIDGIIIQRLDRIGRSVKDLSNLIDKLEKNNKKFIATEQNINTNTIEGKLLVGILSVIAEFNANLFKERSKEGRERYLAEVDKDGKPIHSWGRKKIIIPEKIKKEVINLYKNGLGTTKLSKYLIKEGIIMTPNTVYLRLKEWNIETKRNKDGFVYFVQAENGLIKIGWTENIKKRINNLQTSSPFILNVLYFYKAVIGEEKIIHERFEQYKHHNEWFQSNKEILDYIQKRKEEDKIQLNYLIDDNEP